jgi:hypothetical protein
MIKRKKEIQFEVWEHCMNRCSFCYNVQNSYNTDKEVKIEACKRVLSKIENIDFNIYDNISLIGGDFWQGEMKDPEVKEAFWKILRKIHEYLKSKKILCTWITATLTIGDNKDLYEMLDYFSDIESHDIHDTNTGLWLCTSWDKIGRFHTPKHLANWEYHMDKIYNNYPNLQLNTTIILQSTLIEEYLSGDFCFNEFAKKHHTSIFLKTPGVGHLYQPDFNNNKAKHVDLEAFMNAKKAMEEKCPGMFVSRPMFLKFLHKLLLEQPDHFHKLFNIDNRAERLYKNHNEIDKLMEEHDRIKDNTSDTEYPECALNTNLCGHDIVYAGYIDSSKCAICDKLLIKKQVTGDLND